MYTPLDHLIAAAVICLASIVHGYTGFGMGMISFAMLCLLPHAAERMAVVVTLNALVTMGLLLALTGGRGKIDWRQVGLVLGGCAISMPIGYWFLSSYGDSPMFRTMLGVLLVIFARLGLNAPRPEHRPAAWIGFAVGLVGGFIGGAFISGGPPIVLYLFALVDDPREMKATVQLIFVATLVYRLFLAQAVGAGYTVPLMTLAAWAAPFGAFGMWYGHRLSQTASKDAVKRWVYTLIAVFGVMLAVKGILAWGSAGPPA